MNAYLTPREQQILALYVQMHTIRRRYSCQRTADALHISPKTVNAKLDICQWKLEVANREQLLDYARSHGLDVVQEVSA